MKKLTVNKSKKKVLYNKKETKPKSKHFRFPIHNIAEVGSQ